MENFRAGLELETQTLPPVSSEQIGRYAEASGDHNPIHLDEQAAKESGLPDVISHGMLTMATVGRLFSPYLDRGFVKSFQTRFAGRVFPGDVLTIGGKLVDHEGTESGEVYHFEVFANNQDGNAVATGKVAFHLHPNRQL